MNIRLLMKKIREIDDNQYIWIYDNTIIDIPESILYGKIGEEKILFRVIGAGKGDTVDKIRLYLEANFSLRDDYNNVAIMRINRTYQIDREILPHSYRNIEDENIEIFGSELE